MTTLVCAKAITSIREVWWDIRPHPNFGTVELRICDGLPMLDEVAAVAALSQCLVEWMDSLFERGYTLPTHRSWITKENKWRAARRGVEAEIIVNEDGALMPLRQAMTELVEELEPTANRLGCVDELQTVLRMLDRPRYVRQREVVEQGGSLVDVVDQLTAELAGGSPGIS